MDRGERLPPQATDMETHVLGSMLLDPQAASAALEKLQPDDFYLGRHQKIFEVAANLFDKEQSLDQALLREELKRRELLEEVGGVAYIAELVASVPTTAHVERYAEVVRECALTRRLIATATQIVENAYEPGRDAQELLEFAEQKMFSLSTSRADQQIFDMREIIHDVYKDLESSHGKGGAFTGIPTGYTDLDELSCGLQPGELIIIAGRPSTGKTTFGINVLNRLALNQGMPVGLFSLEMTKEQVARNLACLNAKVDSLRLRKNMLNDEEWGRLVEHGMGRMREAPIFVDDCPGEPLIVQLRARARRMVAQQKVGLLIFDYLQLIHGPKEIAAQSRQQEVAYISRSLKALARELKIPIIALCQLNRGLEGRTNKRPQLSDLRESGAIEQDADLVLLIHRSGLYEEPEPDLDKPITMIVAKNRNGPVGDFKLSFLYQYFCFESYIPEGLEE